MKYRELFLSEEEFIPLKFSQKISGTHTYFLFGKYDNIMSQKVEKFTSLSEIYQTFLECQLSNLLHYLTVVS